MRRDATLAGPVTAAAVVFPRSWLETGLPAQLRGLNDSKQLTEDEREKFFAPIQTHAEIRWAIAALDARATIERMNIRQAAWQAMQRALDRLEPRRGPRPGGWSAHQVAALPSNGLGSRGCAELLRGRRQRFAKVTRDRLMRDYDLQFPGYGFAITKAIPPRSIWPPLPRSAPARSTATLSAR